MALFKTSHIALLATALLIHVAVQILPPLDFESLNDIASNFAKSLPGHQENLDIDRNIHQLIESRNFKAESHFITTADGYILQLIRIVNPFLRDRSNLKPVLLFHGFQCSGSLWIVASNGTLMSDGHYYEYDGNNQLVNGSETVGNTLGFVLATQGYDVWLANYRGSIYSTNHTTLEPDSAQFWSFSMDDMIQYDLPAMIDHIVYQTNQPLAYIGHSQGNFLMFSLLASDTSGKYSNLIQPFIALSPVVFTRNMQTPTRHFQVFTSQLSSYPWSFFRIDRLRVVYSQLCSNQYISPICFSVYSLLLGTEKQAIDMNRIGVYLANIPMGSSSRNAAHFFQMFTHGIPTRFDYGDDDLNLAVHGAKRPPLYNVSTIQSRNIALIYLKDDWFNSVSDVNLLKEHLTVDLLTEYQVPDESLNHMELVWGKQVGQRVNSKVLHILNKF